MPFNVDELSDFLIKHYNGRMEFLPHAPGPEDMKKSIDNFLKQTNSQKLTELTDEDLDRMDAYESGYYSEVSIGRNFERLHEYYENPSLHTANSIRVDIALQMFPFTSLEQIFAPRKYPQVFEQWFRAFLTCNIISKQEVDQNVESICKVCETPDSAWQQALEKSRPALLEMLKKVGFCIDLYRADEATIAEIEASKEVGSLNQIDEDNIYLKGPVYERVNQPYLKK